MIDLEFSFTTDLWIYPGPSAWHFLSAPQEAAEKIRFFVGKGAGFGSARVKATIGDTIWQTSIFPDKERGTYLLPVKADVRKKESLSAGDNVAVSIKIDV